MSWVVHPPSHDAENVPPKADRAGATPRTHERSRSREPLQHLFDSPPPPPPPALQPSRLFDARVLLIAENASGAARWYNVRLVCLLRPDLAWRVTRRYRDFDALLQRLQRDATQCELPALPPKVPQLLMTPALQQRRVLGLQKFCQELLASPALCAHAHVGDFFELGEMLWHVHDHAPPPRQLDPAQCWAVVLVQAHVRQLRVRRRVQAACAAIAECRADDEGETVLVRSPRKSSPARRARPVRRLPLSPPDFGSVPTDAPAVAAGTPGGDAMHQLVASLRRSDDDGRHMHLVREWLTRS